MRFALGPRRPPSAPVRWEGARSDSVLGRTAAHLRRLLGIPPSGRPTRLPPSLREHELAPRYLDAQRLADHRRAGVVAAVAWRRELDAMRWSPAEAWAQRALWHFEHAGMWLHAARTARRIGEVHLVAGDAAGARRYFAEAIAEARDLGASREEGLAALGLGRAEIELGHVTAGRRLAQISVDLLSRCRAPASEIAAAKELRGTEIRVGDSEAA